MPEGHEVVFDGEADESPDWEPGDVILKVRSKKEVGSWRRKETSLYWKEIIGIDEVGPDFQTETLRRQMLSNTSSRRCLGLKGI